MNDEYSDETYEAWNRLAAAVRDRSRDWIILKQSGPQCLADYQSANRANMARERAMAMMRGIPRSSSPYSPFGGLFGGLI